MRKLTQRSLLLCLLLLVVMGSYTVTRAHANYDRSDPAADAQLTSAPTQVRVWFTQELFRREGMNALEVYGADGSRVDTGAPTIDDDDRTLMIVALAPTLPDGQYTVRWEATSAEDGHTAAGEFAFTVASTGGATAALTTSALSRTAVISPTVAPSPTAAPPTELPATTGAEATATAQPANGLPGNCALGALPLLVALVIPWRRRAAGKSSR